MQYQIAPAHKMPCKIVLGIILLSLAACTAPAPQPIVETGAPAPTASSTPTNDPYPPSQVLDYTRWPTQEPYPPPSPVASGYKPSPTRRPRPRPTNTPLPVYDWAVPAVEVDSQTAPEWYEGDVQKEAPDPFTSPNGQYQLACGDKTFSVYTLPERKIVGTANIPPKTRAGCSNISWRPYGSAVAFSSASGFYIWFYKAALPKKIELLPPPRSAYAASTAWSTDGSELVVLLDEITNGKHGPGVYGQSLLFWNASTGHSRNVPLIDVRTQLFGGVWVTPDVLEFRDLEGEIHYIDTLTGKEFLFQYSSMGLGPFLQYQPVLVSPDKRWITLDNLGKFTFVSVDYLDYRGYRLYDTQTHTDRVLADSSEFFIQFTAWAPDSSHLYWVNIPTWDAPNPQGLPGGKFGLVSYDPLTQRTDVLLENAFQVEWNADTTRAWVAVRRKAQDGTDQLVAGIWEPGSSKLIGETVVFEGDLNEHLPSSQATTSRYESLFNVSWSNSGQKVVFTSATGELILADLSGETLTVTHRMVISWGRNFAKLVWSPDDNYLLINHGYGIQYQTLLTIPANLADIQ